MATGYLLPINNSLQYFTDQGVILAGGKVYTYEAGTTTPVATYTSSTLGVANANPIVLDSAGRLPNGVWIGEGVTVKVVVKTSAGVQVGPTLDNLSGINDISASQAGGDSGASGVGTAEGISVQQALDNLRDDQPTWCGTAAGTADALSLTPTPAKTAYVAGQTFWFIAASNNTGAATVNVSGLGAISLKKNGSSGLTALVAGDIRTGDVYVAKISTTSQAVLANPSAQASTLTFQGSYGARGLICYNNAGTPNTKLDMTASQLTLWSPADSSTVVLTSPATKTNDIGASSPAADARDQGASFTDPSFIHFYWIYKSSDGTLSSISSAVAPPTGPTLPTGYTHWAYAGAVYFVGGALKAGRIVGDRFYYDASYSSANTGGLTATTETTQSLATFVPTNALDMMLGVLLEVSTGAGGADAGTFRIRLSAGVTYQTLIVRCPVASGTNDVETTVPVPVIGGTPQFLYIWDALGPNATSQSAEANVYSYRIPNGAT